MYAYKESVNYSYDKTLSYDRRHMQAVPSKTVYRKHKVVKQQKKRTRTLASSLIILSAVLFFCAIIMPFSFKTVKTLFFHNIMSPHTNKATSSFLLKSHKYQSGADLETLISPTIGYMSNDIFLNKRLLAPSIKNKKYASNLYMSERMLDLENQLKGLNKAYPMIKPAIFVWSFETGKYAALNADTVYPAASIIKIPVLVQLFKSIEANQVTLYDELVLTNYFRASGSGDIQYAQEGRKYTLDSLAKTMIQDSDNSATNMLMAKIGGMDDVNTGLRSWGLKNTHITTWLPDLTGTNTTTASDLGKILYNLENPAFLNINSREDIFKYMSKVKNNRLIQAGLPQGVPFMHKTGDIGKMLGDAGIVYLPTGEHYIVVILAERPHNHPAGVNFIKDASAIIYSKMSKLNN